MAYHNSSFLYGSNQFEVVNPSIFIFCWHSNPDLSLCKLDNSTSSDGSQVIIYIISK